MTIALQALSLVEKAEPVRVARTNGVSEHQMDVKSTWIPTWHTWIMFHGHLDYFQKPPLGGRPNTKPRDHGTPKSHDH